MTVPRVAVILVNWNGRGFLGDCLGALRRLHYDRERLSVILVDNGSTDDSLEFVAREFPEVKILENHQNNYAGANNLGVKSSGDVDYVALLNNDTIVDENWLKELVIALENHPEAAASGSKILFMDGRVNSTGIEALDHFHWRDRGFGEEDRGQFETLESVDGLSGCAILLRRRVFCEHEGLDEDFEMYYEDVDLSLRLRKAGHELLFVPKSLLRHRYNASIDQLPSKGEKDRFGERNRLFVIARHYAKNLPRELPRSRFFYESRAREFRKFVPIAMKKWVEGGASSNEVRVTEDLILESKRLSVRLRRRARGEARTAQSVTVEKKRAIASMEQELLYHQDLVKSTSDRFEKELEGVRDSMASAVKRMSEERDQARAAYEKEHGEKEERERWIGILLRGIQKKRSKKLDEHELAFLDYLESKESPRDIS